MSKITKGPSVTDVNSPEFITNELKAVNRFLGEYEAFWDNQKNKNSGSLANSIKDFMEAKLLSLQIEEKTASEILKDPVY
jgi:hypothetical protein